jgi:uncharacterized protein GlcG (DUF336 family)
LDTAIAVYSPSKFWPQTPPAYGIHVSNHGRFMIVGGGLPIFVDGRIVGGIGCSSGTTQQDRDVAMAGIEALAARTRPARRRSKARRTA